MFIARGRVLTTAHCQVVLVYIGGELFVRSEYQNEVEKTYGSVVALHVAYRGLVWLRGIELTALFPYLPYV